MFQFLPPIKMRSSAELIVDVKICVEEIACRKVKGKIKAVDESRHTIKASVFLMIIKHIIIK